MGPSVVTKSKSTVQFAKSDSKKEEKKRQKELKAIEKQQKQIRDHLTREKDFNNASHQRGWQDWQAWCEEVKYDDLRMELRAVTQSVSHLLDKSRHAVETLEEHRAHAEEQYLRNFQQHVELIDYIAEIYKIFQESAHQLYEGEREQLVADFYEDAFHRDSLHHQKKVYYENFSHVSITLTKCRLHDMKEEFGERKVEIESASVVRREDDMERVMKREAIACSEIRNLVNLFNNKLWPKNRFEQYQEALKKSTHFDKIIKDLGMKTEDYLKKIAKFEDELQSFSREHLVKGAELKSEYFFMTKLMQQAEEKIKTERNWDHEKMKRLVTVGTDAKKLLSKKLEKGISISAAMKICAKYERLDDKLECSESSDECQTTVDEEFFKKLAKVEADCVMLRSFKAEMLAQNEKLQVAVKEANHEFKVHQNIRMLRLDPSPSVGQPVQVAHQISQIKVPIKLRKRWKLCKQCQRDVNNM